MIPQIQDDLKQGFTLAEIPSKTFQMQQQAGRIAGKIDRKKAMEQAIYLILSVERYEYLIHSWNFGIELQELFGQPVSYCLPEIKRRITEALLQDDRIEEVYDFAFEVERGRVKATFRVKTSFGEIEAEKEVSI